jgi:hypothetical protein
MENFLLGAIAMGSFTAAIFFLRCWRDTGDRLFAGFCAAFVLLGITRVGLAASGDAFESQTPWYWLRLVAFLFILAVILDKNRR